MLQILAEALLLATGQQPNATGPRRDRADRTVKR